MARVGKNELVTASFHYIQREVAVEGSAPSIGSFSSDEFDKLCNSITNQQKPDLSDDVQFRKVKFGQIVPFFDLLRVDTRTLFGAFEGAYSGHSFTNSEKGSISATSINQRRFYFCIYLSDTGRIYIGTQYLGNYGDYIGLKNTISGYLQDSKNIEVYSFKDDAINFSNAIPKEVRVSLSSLGDELSSKNIFNNGTIIAVRKREKGDGFEEKVRESIFPLLKSPTLKRREALAKIIADSKLMDVKDLDIEDCTIVVSFSGRDRVIHMFNPSNFASKYVLTVDLMPNGHPKREQAQKEMIRILRGEIISRKEDG